MKYSVRAFNAGTFWVPGPEVYWMEAWNQREGMNILIYLVQGGGQNILINTGPPQDLTIINQAWFEFFGYPESQIVRTEDQLPHSILRSQGLSPEDISLVLVTPLQAYATANIAMFRRATIAISRRGWIEDFQAPY
jgi:glyoxylase-like metal-dependent hydrolase (beta-lactamase superfamily II)